MDALKISYINYSFSPIPLHISPVEPCRDPGLEGPSARGRTASEASAFATARHADAETVVAVHHLLDVVQQFPQHFDESSMFSQGADAEVSTSLG